MVKVKEMLKAELDEHGHEIVSSVPMAPPVGFVRQPSVNDRLRQMVRSAMLEEEATKAGAETFEESDDFGVDDDPEMTSPYEIAEVTGEVEVVEPVKLAVGLKEAAEPASDEKPAPPAPDVPKP